VFLGAFCLIGTAFAQSLINGKVVDKAGTALPFTTIGLMSAPDSILIKVTASDDKGVYIFEKMPYGKYLVKASFVG
jgi:hypothetical protein